MNSHPTIPLTQGPGDFKDNYWMVGLKTAAQDREETEAEIAKAAEVEGVEEEE